MELAKVEDKDEKGIDEALNGVVATKQKSVFKNNKNCNLKSTLRFSHQ